ncbi:hypothetical protein [Nocardioides nitrophenolicus]|uniref:hypothetical protein n=1 Tax=Nocardioides nitrophenolicus TaxID=60489 RepID=UPI0019565796|nr:hypothetical protein [Nocardioides nitrophenolicus]MBM7516366.1 hypothetical protein [Nocardioides nitrophenolicus]
MENRSPKPADDVEREQGQVSEVSRLDDAGEVVSPSDSVAGHPTDRDVQEGKAGPNARTGNQDVEEER